MEGAKLPLCKVVVQHLITQRGLYDNNCSVIKMDTFGEFVDLSEKKRYLTAANLDHHDCVILVLHCESGV